MVGSYIYEKLGRNGLIVSMQDFAHELPLKEYAKVYFGENLVSEKLKLLNGIRNQHRGGGVRGVRRVLKGPHRNKTCY